MRLVAAVMWMRFKNSSVKVREPLKLKLDDSRLTLWARRGRAQSMADLRTYPMLGQSYKMVKIAVRDTVVKTNLRIQMPRCLSNNANNGSKADT